MKNMLIRFFFITVFFLFFGSELAFGYVLDWVHIRHRTYENRDPSDILQIYVFEDYTHPEQIVSENVIESIVLQDYNGRTLATRLWSFYVGEGFYGYLDTNTGEIPFEHWPIDAAWYYEILEPVSAGNYTVTVTFNNGNPSIIYEYYYSGYELLPFVNADSFRYQYYNGDFVLSWTPPDLDEFIPNTTAVINVNLDYHRDDNLDVEIWVGGIPLEVGQITIPAYVFNQIGEFRYGKGTVSVRVEGNKNRAYSDLVYFGLSQRRIVQPDTQHPTGAVHAYDNVIWHANKKMKRVTLAGYVKDEMSIARDDGGIGVSEAYILINGNRQIDLSLDEFGNFSENVFLKAKKGRTYTIELYASDTNPDGPNFGLVDTTYVLVPHDMGERGKKNNM